MGQAGHTKDLAQVGGKLNLGTAQHQIRLRRSATMRDRSLPSSNWSGDSSCHGPPAVLPLQAAADAGQPMDAAVFPAPARASPATAALGRDAGPVPYARSGGGHRSTPPPAELSRIQTSDGHRSPPVRSVAHPQGIPQCDGQDPGSRGRVPPRPDPKAAAAEKIPAPGWEPDGIEAERIRPLPEAFPPPARGSPAPPVPPARPRPPCGPGCGSDRWWRCAPSRKSRHGPPAG